MGLFGIGRGIFKIVKGALEGDTEEIVKGGKKIVKNVIVGDILSNAHTDEDDDD